MGGMVVDNDALMTTYGGASSIYFMPVASNLSCGDGSTNEGCAVKLTQPGLKWTIMLLETQDHWRVCDEACDGGSLRRLVPLILDRSAVFDLTGR
jgi:hypothetical protein